MAPNSHLAMLWPFGDEWSCAVRSVRAHQGELVSDRADTGGD